MADFTKGGEWSPEATGPPTVPYRSGRWSEILDLERRLQSESEQARRQREMAEQLRRSRAILQQTSADAWRAAGVTSPEEHRGEAPFVAPEHGVGTGFGASQPAPPVPRGFNVSGDTATRTEDGETRSYRYMRQGDYAQQWVRLEDNGSITPFGPPSAQRRRSPREQARERADAQLAQMQIASRGFIPEELWRTNPQEAIKQYTTELSLGGMFDSPTGFQFAHSKEQPAYVRRGQVARLQELRRKASGEMTEEELRERRRLEQMPGVVARPRQIPNIPEALLDLQRRTSVVVPPGGPLREPGQEGVTPVVRRPAGQPRATGWEDIDLRLPSGDSSGTFGQFSRRITDPSNPRAGQVQRYDTETGRRRLPLPEDPVQATEVLRQERMEADLHQREFNRRHSLGRWRGGPESRSELESRMTRALEQSEAVRAMSREWEGIKVTARGVGGVFSTLLSTDVADLLTPQFWQQYELRDEGDGPGYGYAETAIAPTGSLGSRFKSVRMISAGASLSEQAVASLVQGGFTLANIGAKIAQVPAVFGDMGMDWQDYMFQETRPGTAARASGATVGGLGQLYHDLIKRPLTAKDEYTLIHEDWMRRGYTQIPGALVGLAMTPVHMLVGSVKAVNTFATSPAYRVRGGRAVPVGLREDIQRGGEILAPIAEDMAQGITLALPHNWTWREESGDLTVPFPRAAFQRDPVELFMNMAGARAMFRKVTGIEARAGKRASIERDIQLAKRQLVTETATDAAVKSVLDAASEAVSSAEAKVSQSTAILTAVERRVASAKALIDEGVQSWIESTLSAVRQLHEEGVDLNVAEIMSAARSGGMHKALRDGVLENIQDHIQETRSSIVSESRSVLGENAISKDVVDALFPQGPVNVFNYVETLETIQRNVESTIDGLNTDMAGRRQRLDHANTLNTDVESAARNKLIDGLVTQIKTSEEALARVGRWENLHTLMPSRLAHFIEKTVQGSALVVDTAASAVTPFMGLDEFYRWFAREASVRSGSRYQLLTLKERLGPVAMEILAEGKGTTSLVQLELERAFKAIPVHMRPTVREMMHLSHQIEVTLPGGTLGQIAGLESLDKIFMWVTASKNAGTGEFVIRPEAIETLLQRRLENLADASAGIEPKVASIVGRGVDDSPLARKVRRENADKTDPETGVGFTPEKMAELTAAARKEMIEFLEGDISRLQAEQAKILDDAQLEDAPAGYSELVTSSQEFKRLQGQINENRASIAEHKAHAKAAEPDAEPVIIGGAIHERLIAAREYAKPLAEQVTRLTQRAVRSGMYADASSILNLWWPNYWGKMREVAPWMARALDRIKEIRGGQTAEVVAEGMQRPAMTPTPFDAVKGDYLRERKLRELSIEFREQAGMSKSLEQEVHQVMRFAAHVEMAEVYRRFAREGSISGDAYRAAIDSIERLEKVLDGSAGAAAEIDRIKKELTGKKKISQEEKAATEAEITRLEAVRDREMRNAGPLLENAKRIRDEFMVVDEHAFVLDEAQRQGINRQILNSRKKNAEYERAQAERDISKAAEDLGSPEWSGIREEATARRDAADARINEINELLEAEGTLKDPEGVSHLREFGELAGKAVPVEVYVEFANVSQMIRQSRGWYNAFLRQWKRWKTTWNPTSHMRNMWTNVLLFAPMSGMSLLNPTNLKYYFQAIDDLTRPTSERSSQYRVAMRENATLGTFYKTELAKDSATIARGMMEHLKEGGSVIEYMAKLTAGVMTGGKAWKDPMWRLPTIGQAVRYRLQKGRAATLLRPVPTLKFFLESPGNLYAAMDDIFRLAFHYKLQDQGSKALYGTVHSDVIKQFQDAEKATTATTDAPGRGVIGRARGKLREKGVPEPLPPEDIKAEAAVREEAKRGELEERLETRASIEKRYQEARGNVAALEARISAETDRTVRSALMSDLAALKSVRDEIKGRIDQIDRGVIRLERDIEAAQRAAEHGVESALAVLRGRLAQEGFVDYSSVPGFIQSIRAPFSPVKFTKSEMGPNAGKITGLRARTGWEHTTPYLAFFMAGQPFFAFTGAALPLFRKWMVQNPVMGNLWLSVHRHLSQWNMASAVIDDDKFEAALGRQPTVQEIMAEASLPMRRARGEEQISYQARKRAPRLGQHQTRRPGITRSDAGLAPFEAEALLGGLGPRKYGRYTPLASLGITLDQERGLHGYDESGPSSKASFIARLADLTFLTPAAAILPLFDALTAKGQGEVEVMRFLAQHLSGTPLLGTFVGVVNNVHSYYGTEIYDESEPGTPTYGASLESLRTALLQGKSLATGEKLIGESGERTKRMYRRAIARLEEKEQSVGGAIASAASYIIGNIFPTVTPGVSDLYALATRQAPPELDAIEGGNLWNKFFRHMVFNPTAGLIDKAAGALGSETKGGRIPEATREHLVDQIIRMLGLPMVSMTPNEMMVEGARSLLNHLKNRTGALKQISATEDVDLSQREGSQGLDMDAALEAKAVLGQVAMDDAYPYVKSMYDRLLLMYLGPQGPGKVAGRSAVIAGEVDEPADESQGHFTRAHAMLLVACGQYLGVRFRDLGGMEYDPSDPALIEAAVMGEAPGTKPDESGAIALDSRFMAAGPDRMSPSEAQREREYSQETPYLSDGVRMYKNLSRLKTALMRATTWEAQRSRAIRRGLVEQQLENTE